MIKRLIACLANSQDAQESRKATEGLLPSLISEEGRAAAMEVEDLKLQQQRCIQKMNQSDINMEICSSIELISRGGEDAEGGMPIIENNESLFPLWNKLSMALCRHGNFSYSGM